MRNLVKIWGKARFLNYLFFFLSSIRFNSISMASIRTYWRRAGTRSREREREGGGEMERVRKRKTKAFDCKKKKICLYIYMIRGVFYITSSCAFVIRKLRSFVFFFSFFLTRYPFVFYSCLPKRKELEYLVCIIMLINLD